MLVSLIVSANITDSYGFNVLAAQLKTLQHKGVRFQQFYIFYKFNEYYPQSVVDDLVAYCRNSDLIGISLLSSAFRNSTQITRALKEHIGCPVIWGGKHPSADPEDCLKYADMVCLGEGEDTLVEVVEHMLSGRPPDDIAGLWVRKNGQIIQNPLRPLETTLDRFLFPDYSLAGKFALDKRVLRVRPMEDGDLDGMRRYYPTMITRGCPNCCTFCSNSSDPRMRRMRARSIDNTLQEIKNFLSEHPETERVFFRDDCLSAMPLEWIAELARRYKAEIGLPCSCSGVIATSPHFAEKVRLMSEAGFVKMKMGIQSGCERVRRFVYDRRGETDRVIRRGAAVLHSMCRKVNYYMITDNPYESEDELVTSIRFTSTLPRPFSLSLLSLNFYPGTPLYARALADGHLKDKEEALQESTMDFRDTYLNKVFLSLRFFEMPPFLARVLTARRLYSRPWFQRLFNRSFRFLYRSDTPSRWVQYPRIPFKFHLRYTRRKFRFQFVRRPEDRLVRGTLRWLVWQILEETCRGLHRAFQQTQRHDLGASAK